jgi:polyisoprenoid-binding protein YceI
MGSLACRQPSSSTGSDTAVVSGTGTTYTIDVARSELRWEATKPTGAHQGLVPITAGTMLIHDGMITGGSVTLDMANLSVTDLEGQYKADLEGHLKGTTPGKEEDFFNTQKFPQGKYVVKGSSKLENDPDATHLIDGELTIKEITKPLSIKARVDLGAGTAVKVTTSPFMIDRTEWDVRFMSKKFFDNLKDDFVDDQIKIQITLGAIKQQ